MRVEKWDKFFQSSFLFLISILILFIKIIFTPSHSRLLGFPWCRSSGKSHLRLQISATHSAYIFVLGGRKYIRLNKTIHPITTTKLLSGLRYAKLNKTKILITNPLPNTNLLKDIWISELGKNKLFQKSPSTKSSQSKQLIMETILSKVKSVCKFQQLAYKLHFYLVFGKLFLRFCAPSHDIGLRLGKG